MEVYGSLLRTSNAVSDFPFSVPYRPVCFALNGLHEDDLGLIENVTY